MLTALIHHIHQDPRIHHAYRATLSNDPSHPAYAVTVDPSTLDRTLQARGRGEQAQLYNDVMFDGRALAMLRKRIQAISARPVTVTAASDKADDKRLADLVQIWIDNCGFGDLTEWLNEAINYGLCAAEFLWTKQHGHNLPTQWQGIMPGRLRALTHPRKDGNNYLVRTSAKPTDGEQLPPYSLVVHAHADGNGAYPYGRGLGQTLWYLAYFKRQLYVNWLQSASRFGAPFVMANAPAGNDQQIQAANEELAKVKGAGHIVLPEGVNAELVEAAQNSGEIFHRLIKEINEEITVVVLGEVLTTTASDKGGSRAAAQVHNSVRAEVALRDSERLAETLRETVLDWIRIHNVPKAKLPKLTWQFDQPATTAERLNLIKEAYNLGYVPVDGEQTMSNLLGVQMELQLPPAQLANDGDPA